MKGQVSRAEKTTVTLPQWTRGFNFISIKMQNAVTLLLSILNFKGKRAKREGEERKEETL